MFFFVSFCKVNSTKGTTDNGLGSFHYIICPAVSKRFLILDIKKVCFITFFMNLCTFAFFSEE